MLIGLLLNWGLFIPAAALAIFVWPGGIAAGWSVALVYAMALGAVLVPRVWRREWLQRSLG